MSAITRRQVATGAAWALPVIAVGAAAPAKAASPSDCPVHTVTTATALRAGVRLVLSVSTPVPGFTLTTFETVTGSYRDLDWAPVPTLLDAASLTLLGTGPNTGNDYAGAYTVSYTATGPNGAVCSGTLTFTAAR